LGVAGLISAMQYPPAPAGFPEKSKRRQILKIG
jgi:hypothetical protein